MAPLFYSRCHLDVLASRFSLPSDNKARQRQGAQWLGVLLLSRLLGCKVRNQALGRSAEGAPVHPDAKVSLSHSGQWVAAAVSRLPVGIDIEVPKPRRPIAAMAAQFGWPEHDFYRRWCSYEAALKTGIGDVSTADITQHRGLITLPCGETLYCYTGQQPFFMSIAFVTKTRPKWQNPMLMADEYLLESPVRCR
ncbi:4'-phosphopantetheinyl transferase family protein [Gallaecimonas mangrovi]|uniref:4'-phosphopantetheinyl transferase family protein n=1 Tax=Gallaecimonas mangrovi TaxID=2291597 RepID=UPI000E2009A6|nr:hypothetical protein [Gallaecimonas mangrovi]